MIIILVLMSVILVGCIIFIGFAIKEKDWSALAFLILMSTISFFILISDINAMKRGNRENVEYRFPAEHYKMFEEVTVSNKTTYINGVPVVSESRDTVYVLVGEEPMVIDDNHYERKVLNDE